MDEIPGFVSSNGGGDLPVSMTGPEKQAFYSSPVYSIPQISKIEQLFLYNFITFLFFGKNYKICT